MSYDLAYIYPMELDIELFKNALLKFEGTHNYQDFTSKEEDEGGFVRTIYNIEVIQEGDLLRVIFTGNGFMRYQIRNMIGAAINVANKKEPLEFIDKHLIDNKNREIIAYKAPASGLYLVDVIYD
jgi:tRNA pseudouridine38-40 synthase